MRSLACGSRGIDAHFKVPYTDGIGTLTLVVLPGSLVVENVQVPKQLWVFCLKGWLLTNEIDHVVSMLVFLSEMEQICDLVLVVAIHFSCFSGQQSMSRL